MHNAWRTGKLLQEREFRKSRSEAFRIKSNNDAEFHRSDGKEAFCNLY